MDLREFSWTAYRVRRAGQSWIVALALMALWVVVTAFTLWELTTVGPSLRRLSASEPPERNDQRDVLAWERPNPLLF
jgi:hypothetical protein